jgi:hypothetical protein
MKTALSIAGALLLPMAAFAGSWSSPVTITGYYIWDNGMAHLTTSSNQNPEPCSSAHYLTLDTTQSNFKSMWAQVIAAQASGQTVSLYYDGCIGPHPRIRAISIPNAW